MQDQDNELEIINRKIETIREDTLKIIGNPGLTIDAKRETIEIKREQVQELLDQRITLGWVDIRGNNLITLEFQRLKEGIRENEINPQYSSNGQLIKANGLGRFSSLIPNSKQYKKLRKMALLFDEKSEIENYLLARCVTPTVLIESKYKKLPKSSYRQKKIFYDKKIKNCFRTLNKLMETSGYKVKFRSRICVVDNIN